MSTATTNKNWALVKHTRGKVRARRYCPVTANIKTRMTRPGFDAACKRHRLAAKKQMGDWYQYCLQCKGETLPGTLELVSLAALSTTNVFKKKSSSKSGPSDRLRQNNRKENTMAEGKCELCGKEKKIKLHLDKHLCSTCQIVYSRAKNYPDQVTTALYDFGNLPMAELCETEEKRAAPDIATRLAKLEEKWDKIMILEAACKILQATSSVKSAAGSL